MSEAFVYLWYDARNKKYYLGSHKGKPTDNYAHSSVVMESFTMNTKPSYMHRKILVEGTHEEMLALESKLQTNRKERCWDMYYNDNVCDGLYYGFGSGENHPMYKHGKLVNAKENPEAVKEYWKVKDKEPKRAAWKREYGLSPKRKKYKRDWTRRKIARIRAETQSKGTLEAYL